ncbi:MAG: sensor histidine kinase [Bryobacterales bacterium]|nr:sensor histidine kinase [Bryobacterales bacterium]
MCPKVEEPESRVPEGPWESEPGPESATLNAALAAWRRKAADILMVATVAVHLPVIILVVLGYGPPIGSLVRAISLTAYLVMAAAALLRRFHYQVRLWLYFIAAYLVVALGNLMDINGPYAQVGLVANPIFILVLFGGSAARFATLASAVILFSAPFLRIVPGAGWSLALDPAPLPGVYWFRTAGLAAFLAATMILLDRFHRLLLETFAAQCRAMRERQRLEHEIAAVGDAERRRLGQDLHDGVCQQVTAALLRCQGMESRLQRGGTVACTDLAPLSSLLAETVDDAHNVACGLCPLEPDPEALAAALRALARRTQDMAGVPCEFLAAGDVRVPDPATAQHLYRIAQEALSNASRHACANRIAIELRGGDGELTFQVQDDGTGVPAELPARGMGLRTMACRAQILGGDFTVAPAPGGGTRVTCRVPRPAGAPAAVDPSGEQRWIPAT